MNHYKYIVKMKKGISPLLATILLIGIVIALAILIWIWQSGILEDTVTKIGSKSSGQLACSQEIAIRVSNVECLIDKITFDVENVGSTNVNKFVIVKTFPDGNIETVTLDNILSIASAQELTIDKTTDPDKIEIIPVVIRSNAQTDCREQSVTTNTC
jgi:flagellin-like protein